MKPGELRHRLTFQRKTESRDSFGAVHEDWVDDFTIWGAFEPIGSREYPVSAKRFAESTARFRVRYIDVQKRTIDPDFNRILLIFDANASPAVQSIWDIWPPLPLDGKRFELHIEAKERV